MKGCLSCNNSIDHNNSRIPDCCCHQKWKVAYLATTRLTIIIREFPTVVAIKNERLLIL
jgi:hypothetical protein